MRFHLAALPGQPVGGPTARPTCAFTEKVRKFPAMMKPFGHEVIVYGDSEWEHEGEHVACYSSCSEPPAFTQQDWHPFNDAAVKAIKERMEPGDVLGLMGGNCQASLVHDLPELLPVEYGIGYGGCFAPFKVFESRAWQHTCYGEQRGSNTADGSYYDAVIPAYFETELFPDGTESDDGYLLYVGRLTERKGMEVVTQTAKALGVDLILAGEGEWKPDYGECVGVVRAQERGELMANARALICPTQYIEPFGCISVEAQLCGTPVLATDWGAFTETVEQGKTGYRCHKLGEFMWAFENVDKLDKQYIRRRAQETYSLEAIGPQYDHYFRHLDTLNETGWYDTTKVPPYPQGKTQ